MTALQKVSQSLYFSEKQYLTVKECLDNYINFNFLLNITNLFESVVGPFPWQKAQNCIFDQLLPRFSKIYSSSEVNSRTFKAAEFVLRYLITETTCERGMPFYSLPEKLRNTEKLWAIPISEITFRASHGDGSTFPLVDYQEIKRIFLKSLPSLEFSMNKSALVINEIYSNQVSTDLKKIAIEVMKINLDISEIVYLNAFEKYKAEPKKLISCWEAQDILEKDFKAFQSLYSPTQQNLELQELNS
ncbi:MAG: hypothetical protein JHC93_01770 [Parachlamydiales bacterium]|nr:hypothetical protein [Parachlamydiales bacterium]